MARKRSTPRNRPKPTTTPPAPQTPPEALDKAVLLLCSGCNAATAAGGLAEALKLDPDEAARIVAEAKATITRAATIDHDHEAGQAYYRLTDLYLRSLRIQDTKTALAAQRELNRLLGLHAKQKAEESAEASTELERAVAAYLAPLKLAPAGSPAVEHVRLAAQSIADALQILDTAGL